MDLGSGTTAVVTGGSSGLGAAVVGMLAQRGVDVTVFDLRPPEGTAAFAEIDVTDAGAVGDALREVRARRERIDLMVTCAGIAPGAKTVSRGAAHDPALFARTIGINLIGSFNCSSQAALAMSGNEPQGPDGERGVIVLTASIAAWEGQVGQTAYAASKGGIVGMTLPMARDLAGHGIRVCAIAPGLFLTPMLRGLPDEVQASLGAQVPYPPRLGDPAEFAALVAHIAENRMLNGETIRLDGAIRLTPR